MSLFHASRPMTAKTTSQPTIFQPRGVLDTVGGGGAAGGDACACEAGFAEVAMDGAGWLATGGSLTVKVVFKQDGDGGRREK